jgi:hypothetical protein
MFPETPDTCPNCGADVPSGARACPECGADEETGWSERARYENLGIPDDSFDYNEFVKQEFEGETRARNRRKMTRTVATILLLVAFVPGLFYLVVYMLGTLFPR